MKLSKTNPKEIASLMGILQEIEQIQKHHVWEGEGDQFEGFKEELLEAKESFPICTKLLKDCFSKDEFYQAVFQELSGINFQRILANCSTLLENCANPDLSHLDFNTDIKRGLKLLEAEEKVSGVVVGVLKKLTTDA